MAANYFNKDKAGAPVKKKRINWQQSLKTSETNSISIPNSSFSITKHTFSPIFHQKPLIFLNSNSFFNSKHLISIILFPKIHIFTFFSIKNHKNSHFFLSFHPKTKTNHNKIHHFLSFPIQTPNSTHNPSVSIPNNT